MDFWANLALAFSFASHRKKKEQQKRAEEIKFHWNKIANSVFHLGLLLNELCFSQRAAIDKDKLEPLKELAPLFPLAEILSLQGYVGQTQEEYLRDYNIHQSRYNLNQFLTAAIEREGKYSEWNALCGVDKVHCGQIWHTYSKRH